MRGNIIDDGNDPTSAELRRPSEVVRERIAACVVLARYPESGEAWLSTATPSATGVDGDALYDADDIEAALGAPHFADEQG